MTITATIIADSINEAGSRLTTMQLRYPRFIHAEFMTHRVFSRNASSSRAIPVAKLIDDVIRDTAMPIHWGKNQPGMQAREEHDHPVAVWDYYRDGEEILNRQEAWENARDKAIEVAQAFNGAGYHKQIVNRLLEPFSHINVVVTATEWDNFYALRRHPDAQPEIKELADRMYEAQQASIPTPLRPGDWHMPYVEATEAKAIFDYIQNTMGVAARPDVILPVCVKLSVARCARVSYLTHDGKKPSVEADLVLYDRLVGAVPLHASPAEHQATPGQCVSNFHPSWFQYRKQLELDTTNSATS